MNNAPIGVFDSGLGGLTVWRELYRKLPHESLIYYGDGKNCPYGDKNREEVTAYVDLAVRRLIDRGVKLIVVACNAATAMAIDHLRRNYALPLVGLEPAVKPAAMASRSGVIGILATAATLNGRLFRETSQRYADRVKILTQVGEGFVELVESNREQTPEALARVDKLLRPMLDAGADQIVLGCTHYPVLEDAVRRFMGESVTLINPGVAVAQAVKKYLEKADSANEGQNIGTHRFFVTDKPGSFKKTASVLLGEEIDDRKVEQVDLNSLC